MLAAGLFSACGRQPKAGADQTVCPRAVSPQAQALLQRLHAIGAQGIMYGHHDDTLYGIGWQLRTGADPTPDASHFDALQPGSPRSGALGFAEATSPIEDVYEPGRSDVQSVCGDYPAVISFDLGGIELGTGLNLDQVPFDLVRQEAIRQYQRGGLVSMSWHPRNPLTGGDAWDTSDSTVVRSILPGGSRHELFVGWLDRLADFLLSINLPDAQDRNSGQTTCIPILFRPWHEHTGSWFWWGQSLCSTEEYLALWGLTTSHLQERGVDQLLYAYSPGVEPQDTVQYLERYPGDQWVDVVGFDAYQFDADPTTYREWMERMQSISETVAQAHGKVMAVTETGYEGIPAADWWTATLLPALEGHTPAYVLTWRNAREKPGHYYAPYPGHPSAADFQTFYHHPRTLFAADVDLYTK